tara:strand:+ start:1344 stop:1514 length:171 start_codon:yes stop_codon:yes gene_type:complete
MFIRRAGLPELRQPKLRAPARLMQDKSGASARNQNSAKPANARLNIGNAVGGKTQP